MKKKLFFGSVSTAVTQTHATPLSIDYVALLQRHLHKLYGSDFMNY